MPHEMMAQLNDLYNQIITKEKWPAEFRACIYVPACPQERGHNAWTARITEPFKISPSQQNDVGHY